MKERALKLALAVYRLTNLFPEGDVIIGKIRKTAAEILEEIEFERKKEALLKINILLNFLAISQAQNWVREENFFILKKEYNNLIEELKESKEKALVEEKKDFKKDKDADFKKELNLRQKKILETAKKQKRIKIGDFINIFSDVSRKTLSRDLEDLCKRKYLEGFGSGRGRFYQKF